MKFLIALLMAVALTACGSLEKAPAFDNSKTNINDVRTTIIDGDDYRKRDTGFGILDSPQ